MIRSMRFVPAALLSAAALSLPLTLRAQASAPASTRAATNPVAGKWVAQFELGMRNENGVVSSTGTGKARITLEAKGDSVFGQWVVLEPTPPSGAPTPQPLKGVFANGTLTLETAPTERRVMLNGDAMTLKMMTRYQLKLDGETLAGTAQPVALGGEIEPPSRPFSATREH